MTFAIIRSDNLFLTYYLIFRQIKCLAGPLLISLEKAAKSKMYNLHLSTTYLPGNCKHAYIFQNCSTNMICFRGGWVFLPSSDLFQDLNNGGLRPDVSLAISSAVCEFWDSEGKSKDYYVANWIES